MSLNLFLFFVFLGFFILVLDYKRIKDNTFYLIIIIFIGLATTNFYSIWETDLFNCDYWKIIFLGLVFISTFIIINLVHEKTFDIYCLVILVFLGSIILITSDNLITLYLGLELQTFSIFILVAKNRSSIKSSEAGLKYFILGAISSGFYLLGVTLLFLFGYSLNIKELSLLLNNSIIIISVGLITLSFCFKLSLFPLHFWIPDIYEGSSWDIITLISTLPKLSMLCVLIQLLINSSVILSFSLLSIIIGTLGALNQNKIKRLLAYSGISHMGFIVLGYSILNNEGLLISNIYLIIYMLTMISVFIFVIFTNINNKFIIELSSFKFINRILAITLVLLILSIGGIPPLSGFISKWFLIWTTIEFNYRISALIMIIFSAIGAGYYLRIVKILYFQKKSSYFSWEIILKHKQDNNEILVYSLGFFIFLTTFLILNFSSIINIINYTMFNSF